MAGDPNLLESVQPGARKTKRQIDALVGSVRSYVGLIKQAALIHALERGVRGDALKKAIDDTMADNPTYLDMDDETRREAFENNYRSALSYDAKDIANEKNKFAAKVKAGGLMMAPQDVEMTAEQVDKLKQRQPWMRTPHQVLLEMSRSSTPEQLGALALYATSGRDTADKWLTDPELAEKFDKMMGEPQFTAPSKEGPLYIRGPLEALGAGGSAVHGAIEGALPAAREATAGLRPVDTEDDPEDDLVVASFGDKAKSALEGVINAPLTAASRGLDELGALWAPVKSAAQSSFGDPNMLQQNPLERTAEMIGQREPESGVLDIIGLPKPEITMGDLKSALMRANPGSGAVETVKDLLGGARYAGVPIVEAVKELGGDAFDLLLHPRPLAQAYRNVEKIRRDPLGAGISDPISADRAMNEALGPLTVDRPSVRALAGAAEGASEVFSPRARLERITENRNAMRDDYEREAVTRSEESGADPAVEYEKMLGADYAIESPALAQAVGETVADPTNIALGLNPVVVGGRLAGAGLRAGVKAAESTKAGASLLKGLREGMTWAPEMAKMERAADAAEAAGNIEQAAKLRGSARAYRASMGKGTVEARKMFEPVEKTIAKMPAEGTERGADVWRAATWPEKYGETAGFSFGEDAMDVQYARDFAREMKEIEDQLGGRRYFDEGSGVLYENPPMENYTASSVRKEIQLTPEEAEKNRLLGYSTQKTYGNKRIGRMEESHHKKDLLNALQDIRKQSRVKTAKARRVAEPIKQTQNIDEVSKVYEQKEVLPMPHIAETQVALREVRRRLPLLEKRQAKIEAAKERLWAKEHDANTALWDEEQKTRSMQVHQPTDPLWAEDRQRRNLLSNKVSSTRKAREKLATLETRSAAELATTRAELPSLEKKLTDEITNDKALWATLKHKSESDGVDYTVMETFSSNTEHAKDAEGPTLELPGEFFKRVTGEVGVTSLPGTVTIVPKPVAELIERISITAQPPDKTLGAMNEVGAWMLDNVRALQRMWRITHTVLSLPYHLRNAISAFGLSTVTHGSGALNPKLQSSSIAAALATGGFGEEGFRALKWKTSAGVETTIGAVLDSVVKMGVIDITALRTGLDIPARYGAKQFSLGGPTKWLENKLVNFDFPLAKELGLTKVSPANINKVTENYQHLVAYMGFLKDPNDFKSVYEAADLAAQFSGSVGRLGKWEKKLLVDTFGFYAWNRFATPHLLDMALKRPDRFSPWERGVNYMEAKHGEEAPVYGEGIPKRMRGLSFTAPGEFQPPPGAVGSHEFAIAQMESPLTMLTALWPALVGSFTEGEGRSLTEAVGPGVKFLIENITHEDLRTGMPIPGFWGPGTLPSDVAETTAAGRGEPPPEWSAGAEYEDFEYRARNSQVWRLAFSFAERPSRDYMNLIKLYWNNDKPAESLDLALRFAAGNSWKGLDHVAAQMGKSADLALGLPKGTAGFDAKSLGGYFQTLRPFDIYLADVPKEVASTQRNAAENARGYR